MQLEQIGCRDSERSVFLNLPDKEPGLDSRLESQWDAIKMDPNLLSLSRGCEEIIPPLDLTEKENEPKSYQRTQGLWADSQILS